MHTGLLFNGYNFPQALHDDKLSLIDGKCRTGEQQQGGHKAYDYIS
jgi:hypothetical protein